MRAASELGHGQGGEIALRDVDAIVDRDATLRHQHAHDLDGIERDPSALATIASRRRLRQAGDKASEELTHRRLGKRLEVERGGFASARTPVGTAVDQLGPCEREDVDGKALDQIHR